MKSNTNNLDVRLIVRTSHYNTGSHRATCTPRLSPAISISLNLLSHRGVRDDGGGDGGDDDDG